MSKEKILDEFDKKLLKVCDVYEKAADNAPDKLEDWEKEREEIKQFISDLIAQTREETIKEIEESLPEFKGILIGSNGYFFDNRMSHIDEPKEDIAFNNCLVAVKDILNKLKK